ncbi:hypothetical protein [Nocardioides sp. cx-173]|uniref:hypothetical protein n=1 Tax=Nocardioides sp. cx-173 TaxID=2898796 RepID=UPI001E37D24F|nr:hypothetical protein [Nocardioides sp. cx-173]MCD4524183.1 hypothetical protein [Nocardioides sp. cx-173]UGB41576.1 hypothetical protein LQ940_19750 [Nocardioides sp. cx-173]
MSDPSNPYGGYVPPSPNPYGEAPPPQPYGQPYGQPQPGAYQPAHPGRRPGTVTAAAVVTWVGSAIALICLLFLLVAVQAGTDEFYDGFQDSASGWSRDEVKTFTTVFAVIGIVWSIAAIVLAFCVMRRRNWARILLTVSAALAIPVSLVMALAIVPLLHVILCIAAIVLLYVGGANAWFKG